MKFLGNLLVLSAIQVVPSLAIGLRNNPTTTPPPPDKPPCPKDCKESIYVPDTDCCKYWQCDEGNALLRTCPSGLNWNPNKNVCDWPANAGCDGKGWCDISIVCPTTPKPTTTPTPTKPPNAPPCPADCPYPLYVPDKDCCKYWQCNCGVATRLSCPTNLEWNPILDTCDWPGNAGCTGQGWCDDDLKCVSPNTTTTSSTTTSTKNPNAPRCPADCSILVPNKDCCKYWECDNGVAKEMTCPNGLEFNPISDVCDWPANAGCTGQGWCDDDLKCPPTTKPTTPSTTTKNPNAPPCPADCCILVPSKDCCKYWECDNGIAKEMTCPNGLEFNPISDTCDWPANAGCTGQGWCDDDLKCPK